MLMRLFQWLYDKWYELTGNTQFGLARTFVFLASVSLLFSIVYISAHPTAFIDWAWTIAYGIFLFLLARKFLPMWRGSEIRWDPRRMDSSGNAYRGSHFDTGRRILWGIVLFEFACAATWYWYGHPPGAHICYALMWIAIAIAFYFCTCNRESIDEPRLAT